MTVTNEDDPSLTRAQNRLLRRIYNARSVPIVVDGRPFLTYREATQYLRSLEPRARDAAVAQMKEQAKSSRHDREKGWRDEEMSGTAVKSALVRKD